MNEKYGKNDPENKFVGDYVVRGNAIYFNNKQGSRLPVMHGVVYVDGFVRDLVTQRLSCVLVINPFVGPPCVVRVENSVLHNAKAMSDTLTERGILIENSVHAMKYLKESALGAGDTPIRELVRAPSWLADHRAFYTGRKIIAADDIDSKQYWLESRAGPMTTRSTFEAWKLQVYPFIENNPIMLGMFCVGLESLFLDRLGLSSSIINIAGGKGKGKTLVGQGIASAYGNGIDPAQGARLIDPPYISRFNSTSNGLEALLCDQGPAPTLLDEVTEAGAVVLSEATYLVGSGQKKHTMTSDRRAAERGSWLTTIMLTGERSIASIVATRGKGLYGGQADRAVDIPIDEVGIIGWYGDFSNFNETTRHLKRAFSEHYGTAAERILHFSVNNVKEVNRILNMINKKEEELVPKNCGPGERRVVRRLAGAIVAGYVAVAAGVIEGNAKAKIDAAVELITKLWWKSRGSSLDRIGAFLESNIQAVHYGKPMLDPEAVAFVTEELIIIPVDIFKREFGEDASTILDELSSLSALRIEQEGRYVHRFCGNRLRAYAILREKIWYED